MRTIRLKFVVLDEIDAALGESFHDLCGRFRRQPDAGFDDRADDGTLVHAAKLPRAGDAELRTLIFFQEGVGKLHVQQPEPGKRLQLE